MKKKRRQYSAEFKQQALDLVETSDSSISEIERELGITQGLLARWKRNQAKRDERFGPIEPAQSLAAEKELVQLRRENARLRQEREILKKAVAIFSIPKE